MPTEEITIRVEPRAARAYREASEQERLKLELLLSLRLQDALNPQGSLRDAMRASAGKLRRADSLLRFGNRSAMSNEP